MYRVPQAFAGRLCPRVPCFWFCVYALVSDVRSLLTWSRGERDPASDTDVTPTRPLRLPPVCAGRSEPEGRTQATGRSVNAVPVGQERPWDAA